MALPHWPHALVHHPHVPSGHDDEEHLPLVHKLADNLIIPFAVALSWLSTFALWASAALPPPGEVIAAISSLGSVVLGMGWLGFRWWVAATAGRTKEIGEIKKLNEQNADLTTQIKNLFILLEFQQKENRSLILQLGEQTKATAIKASVNTKRVDQLESRMDSGEIRTVKPEEKP